MGGTGLLAPILGMALLDGLTGTVLGGDGSPTLPDTGDLTGGLSGVLPDTSGVLPDNTGDLASAISGALDDVTQALAPTLGSVPTDPGQIGDGLGLDNLGLGGLLAVDGPVIGPAASAENNIIDDVHTLLDSTGDAAGDPAASIAHALTGFDGSIGLGTTGSSDNLITAVLAAPQTTLDGDPIGAVARIVNETGDTLGSAGTMLNQVVDSLDVGNSLGNGVLQDVAGAIGSGPLVDGNLVDPDGDGSGLVQAVVNSATSPSSALIDLGVAGDGQQSPSQHLIDVDAGPDNTGIGTINVLAAPSNGNGGAQANVLDTGSDGPHLLDADVGTNDSAVPGIDLTGIDLGGGTPGTPAIGDLGGVAGALGGAVGGEGVDLPSIAANSDIQHNLLVV